MEQIPAIEVVGLGKTYRRGVFGAATLREELAGAFTPREGREPLEREFHALKNVSFRVPAGAIWGVVGANGSGKTTLMKILASITEPTEGEVRIRGRVGSLLEVGAGFDPELDGLDNIYLNSAILGMPRAETQRKLDRIIRFADIGPVLKTQVKRYSSGMYTRLAFAVAAHLDAEILLLDEILAVGDMAFQRKCLSTMRELANRGRTILFVSHNMQLVVEVCDHAILLEKGQLIDAATPQFIADSYAHLMEDVREVRSEI